MFGINPNKENSHQYKCYTNTEIVLISSLSDDSQFIEIPIDEWNDIVDFIKKEIEEES